MRVSERYFLSKSKNSDLNIDDGIVDYFHTRVNEGKKEKKISNKARGPAVILIYIKIVLPKCRLSK